MPDPQYLRIAGSVAPLGGDDQRAWCEYEFAPGGVVREVQQANPGSCRTRRASCCSTTSIERAAGTWDRTKFAESLRGCLEEWREILEGNPVQARQILRKLLVGRLTLSPAVRRMAATTRSPGRCRMGGS